MDSTEQRTPQVAPVALPPIRYPLLDQPATALLYGPFALAPVAALVAALIKRAPASLLTITVATLAAVWYIVFRRYQARWEHRRSISFGTEIGIDVILGPVLDRWLPMYRPRLEATLQAASLYWIRYAMANQLDGRRVIAAFGGGEVMFTAQPIPLMSGPVTIAAEIAPGNNVVIDWGAGDSFDRAMSLLWHGCGHKAMLALTGVVDADRDHAIFARVGYEGALPAAATPSS